MRPASRLAMPMFAVPFTRSEEGNEFRCRADERRSVVEPKLGAAQTPSSTTSTLCKRDRAYISGQSRLKDRTRKISRKVGDSALVAEYY